MKSCFITFCVLFNLFAAPAFAQILEPATRSMRRGNVKFLPARKKPNKEQKKLLEPNPLDLTKHSRFLNQPNTGIFRLLPDPGCDENVNVIRADRKCLEAIPQSAFYSFREKEHTVQHLSDVRLKNDHFISDGKLSQSFLVMLGDVRLEDVSLETDGLDYMQNFAAIAEGEEARNQFLQLLRGVKSEDFLYRKILPVSVNTTYALRAVAFRGSLYQTFRGMRYDILDGDNRIDITVAFRIIRKNDDGSLTLLWKELDRRDAPKFKFTKRKTKKK